MRTTITKKAGAVEPLPARLEDHGHTPGPWQMLSVGETGNWHIDHSADGLTSRIATLFDDLLCPEHGGNTISNARLIAAAPCLLAALEDLAGVADDLVRKDYHSTPLEDSVKRARTVIERATWAC